VGRKENGERREEPPISERRKVRGGRKNGVRVGETHEQRIAVPPVVFF
jgi:hypothetical protein